ncbi:MAG: DsrE family protein [Flavobacteriales bacterium]|nr:DsrE family protein [Flavobacteriales bacterium]
MRTFVKWFLVQLFFIHGISFTQVQKLPHHKVIVQLTSADPEVHKNLINQIQALKSRWADSVQIEVVAHGPGIDILLNEKSTFQDKISEFRKKGVNFLACENTLRQKNIPHSALIRDIGFVPFGLVYIIEKQEQGWSYLKAGF